MERPRMRKNEGTQIKKNVLKNLFLYFQHYIKVKKTEKVKERIYLEELKMQINREYTELQLIEVLFNKFLSGFYF